MRRNSITVEEGNVSKENETTIEGNQKRRPERLFLRSASVGLAPGDGEEQSPSPVSNSKINKEIGDEKKHHRRESIKEHLLKFKAKAGKMLEDAQNNKNPDDRNNSFVSQTSENDGKEELSIFDEQAVSESSSQQGTLKKENKEQLRNRIRKSAQKAVERTRGNVQLNRRLARRPTVVIEEQLDENDFHAIDEQIEKVIKMGEKFMIDSKLSNNKNHEIDQFFIGIKNEEKVEKNEIRRVFYGRISQNQYRHDLLVKYNSKDRNIICGEILNREFLSKIYIQPQPNNYSESEFMFYGAAENVEKIQNRLREKFLIFFRRKQYVQLDIFVDSIHVDHHYLWSDEEMICSKLRNEYFAQILRVHQMSQIESHHLEIDTVEKSRLYEEMKNGRETLESWARKLDEARSKQGFTTTKIVFEPAQISWEDDWMKFGKIQQNGLTTPLSKLPKTERERINLLSKTTIQLVLFFNDMEVSKTSWIPLETFLLPVMRRFELELYSPCQSCSFLVLEKQGAKVRQLGKADIPLPSDKDLEIALHEAEFECAQEMNPVGSSYGSNMIMKESGRILCRAILESGQLRVVDDRTNSGSFIDQKNDQRIQKFEVIPSELMLGSIQDEDDEKKSQKKQLCEKLDERTRPFQLCAGARLLDEIREDDRTQKKYKFRSAIDSRRLVSIRFANMSRQRVIDRRRRVEKTYEELVREQSIPTLSVAFSALFSQVDESRRLKPMRKEERAKNEGWQNTIVINIQSAINLPIRDNGQLQPFVIVKFGDEKQIKTDVAFGRHPNWQFTSKLIIENNERNHEFIEIRVYDQIIDELDRDDRLHNIVYQQLTSRLLASAFIRFETLTNVSKINAPIRLKIPVYLSNYKISTESSFIKVLLSTQIPAISSSDCRHSSLSAENQKMLDKCGEFEKALRDPFPKRIIRPLVIDMNCKSTLCCRYLRAINPPTILMQENGDDHFQILTIAAQIISLMPRVKTISHSDVWSTIDQLTSIAVCGLEERAVLLACWLLHFRFPVKIVIGEACGEKTGFVQTEIDSKMWLIDPNDGSIYSNTDSNCPLQNISAAFDATNFYANVQEYHQTPQISLNFTRTALWRPLFSAGDEIPDSVQPSNVHYSRISEDWLLELRIGLEREIKLRFDEARSHAIPQWNLVAARQLREILEAPLTKNSHIEMIVDEKMSRLRDSYSINLSIFRIPYCSVQNCIDEILANKIHENPNSTAQFALAVHIIDFFAHVIRIDIAIASLKPKN